MKCPRCSVCGQTVDLTKKGKVKRHRRFEIDTRALEMKAAWCPGTGKPPKEKA